MKKLILPLVLLASLSCRDTAVIVEHVELKCEARVESCNGKDDDCDGIIDEDLEVKPCYPGDTKELLHGNCRFGVERCQSGSWVCFGAISAEEEVCDGIDNDCDEQIDENGSSSLDIVFAVDYSGSMESTILSLREVTSNWARKYSERTDLRMALVGVPSPDVDKDGEVVLMKNITTPLDFSNFLFLHTFSYGIGFEPSIDAIWLISNPFNPLSISWTPGASRIIVMYTDENAQSYLVPKIDQRQAKNAADSADIKVFIFSSESSWYNGIWNVSPLLTSDYLEEELDKIIAIGSCR